MANLEGTIRIHRSIAGVGAAFRVSFVPYDAESESTATVRSFNEIQQVRGFLKSLGVAQAVAADALRQLTAGRSASIPGVSLDEDDVKDAGLVNTNLAKAKAIK